MSTALLLLALGLLLSWMHRRRKARRETREMHGYYYAIKTFAGERTHGQNDTTA